MAAKTTRAEKVKETKELALNIDATVEIGMLEISQTQAMRVSILRSSRRSTENGCRISGSPRHLSGSP